MSSLIAEKVANEVIDEVVKGRLPNKEAIQIKHGYSKISARKHKAMTTQTYKKITKSLTDRLEEERDAILERLPHVREEAKYRDLTDGLDKITKTHQLLTGGATENIAVKPLATLDDLRKDHSHEENSELIEEN